MVKLIRGSGNPEIGGCWMVACNIYSSAARIGWRRAVAERWTDTPEDVCPVVRALGIRINDSLPNDKERERIIGPHLCLPSGTGGDGYLTDRLWVVLDASVRKWIPRALEAAGLEGSAKKLRALPKVTAKNVTEAAAMAAESAESAAEAAESAARAVARAAGAAAMAAESAESAAEAAESAARAVARAAESAGVNFIETEVMPVMLEICSLGQLRELDPKRAHRVERTLEEAYVSQ